MANRQNGKVFGGNSRVFVWDVTAIQLGETQIQAVFIVAHHEHVKALA
jgi:hypothetical protein